MNTSRDLPDGRIEVNGGIPVLTNPLTLTDLRNELDLYGATVAEAAARAGFPAATAMAILHAEGTVAIARQRHLPPEASATMRSPAGAIGPMQLLPLTAKGLGVADPFDPPQNIDGGVRYLRDQRRRFERGVPPGQSWVPTVAASYNAGHPIKDFSSPWGLFVEGTYIDRVVEAQNTIVELGALEGGARGRSGADTFLRAAVGVVGLVVVGVVAGELAR